MLKSVFLGLGIFALIMGVVFLGIESYTVHGQEVTPGWGVQAAFGSHVVPQPWRPWAYIAAGVVIILWTGSIPKKMAAG